MSQIEYGHTVTLPATDVDTAIERVTAALKDEGFGILSDIDVQHAFKEKLDLDFRPYRILGACNPKLARQAIDAEPHIGLLLPCNVLVQGQGDDTLVSFLAPDKMVSVIDNEDVDPIMKDASERIGRVAASLRS